MNYSKGLFIVYESPTSDQIRHFFCAVTIEEFQVFINLSGIHLLFEYWKPVLYNIELLYTNTPTCQLQKPFIT